MTTNDSRTQTTTQQDIDCTERWYAIKVRNAGALFGYGTRSDADRYLAWLNRDREYDLYGAREMSADEIAESRVDDNLDVGFDLIDELNALEDEGRLDD